MKSHSNPNRRLTSIALVAIFLASALLAAPATASHIPPALGGEPPAAPGELQVITPHVGADPASTSNTVEIKLQNPYGGPDRAIWQFIFSVDAPGGSGAPIQWVATDSEFEDRDDWRVERIDDCNGPDRPGNLPCEALMFVAPKGQELYPGEFAEFSLTFGFTNAVDYCDTTEIRAIGVHTQRNPNTFEYESDTGFNDHQISIVHDDLESDNLILQDLSYYVDEDNNGFLDHVYVQFSKELDPATLDVRDFNVGKRSPDLYPVLEADVIDPINADGTARTNPAIIGNVPEYCTDNSMVKVKFDEEDLYDTGDQPTLAYKKKSVARDSDPRVVRQLTTLAAETVSSQSQIVPIDRAVPRLVSAITKLNPAEPEENVAVLLTWSEPVGKSSDCGTSNTIGVLNPLVDGDWALYVTTPQGISVVPWDLIGEFRSPHDPTSNTLWVDFDLDKSSLYAPLNESSVEYRFEPRGESNLIRLQPEPHRMDLFTSTVGQVCDISGNLMYRPQGTETDNYEPIAEPTIVSVDGNIGFDKVTLTFNTGVNIDEALKNTPQAVFDIADGREGPTGVIGIDHTEGSPIAIVRLDNPLVPLDVSGQPTSFRVEGGKVFAEGTSLGRDDSGWSFVVQEKEIVDVTAPSILFAMTRDLDSNGELDAYELVFSEPISDLSFAQGNPGATGVILDVTDHLNYQRFDQTRGQGINDNEMIISMDPIDSQAGYQTHRKPQFQATQQHINNNWVGLIQDLAVNPDTDTGNWADNITAKDLFELDGAPPVLMNAETLDRDEDGTLDAYRMTFSEPVKDSSFDPAHWFIGGPDEYQVLGLGRDITVGDLVNDHILLVQLQNRTIDPQRPLGDTGELPEILYVAPDGAGLEDLAELPAELGGPNRMVNFGPGEGEDKVIEEDRARPVLMGALGCLGESQLQLHFSEGVSVKENAEAPPRGVRTADIAYANGNPEGVSGIIGDTSKHVAGQRVVIMDVQGEWTDSDYGNDQVSVREDPTNVDNNTGIIKEANGDLQVNLNKVNLGTAKDIIAPEAVDPVRIQPNSVTASGLILNFTIPHDDGCQVFQDGEFFDPAVVGYQVYYNTTRLDFQNYDRSPLVPGSDVAYAWHEPVGNRTHVESPDQLYFERGVGEGQNLTATIVGLEPVTEYFMAIAPVDIAGNLGPISNVVTFTTDEDLTPPVLPDPFEIRSSTHPEGKISKNQFPAFEWDTAVDNESVRVKYHYALSTDKDYNASAAQDPGTQNETVTIGPEMISEFTAKSATGLAPTSWLDDEKTWYFHLSACSGGGCISAGSYMFKIDAPLNKTEVLAFNREIDTTVTYVEEDDQYVVEWDLANAQDAVDTEDCVSGGVQIWRRLEGSNQFEHLSTFGVNDAAYRNGEYVDPDEDNKADLDTRYLVTMYCTPKVGTFWDGQAFQGVQLESSGLYPTEGENQARPTVSNHEGTKAGVEEAPFRVPIWVWIVLGILALLILVGVILFFVLRKGTETELWEEGEIEEDDEESPFGGGALDEGETGESADAESDSGSEDEQ